MVRCIQRACSYVCDLNNTHVVIKPSNCSQQYTIVNKPPYPPYPPPTRWQGPHKTKFIQFSTTSWANSPHSICFCSRDKNIKALKWWGATQAALGGGQVEPIVRLVRLKQLPGHHFHNKTQLSCPLYAIMHTPYNDFTVESDGSWRVANLNKAQNFNQNHTLSCIHVSFNLVNLLELS